MTVSQGPARALRIGIIGYGTAGQAAAVLLSRDGHAVEVFERAPVLGPVGAGFLLQPIGLAVLHEIGLLDAALSHGSRVDRLYGETHAGRPVMDMRYAELDTRLHGLGLQRGALFHLLDDAWTEQRRIHCGHHVTAIDAGRGLIHDSDGNEHGPFDLVLVADGSASLLREAIEPPALNRPYAWGAHWCLVPQAEWQWMGELRQRYVGARRMIGMLPVGTRPGDDTPRLSFFWSVPTTELDGGHDPEALDPDGHGWRAAVHAVWPDAAAQLTATVIPGGLAHARYRDTVMHRWHRGRAVLLGDSAHAMSPQLGQGVNMALLDAIGLRDALRAHADLPAALSSYARTRQRHVAIYHFWSRWLTPLFQSKHDRLAALRDRVFHPMSRVPGGRGQMLRVLTGTRQGWVGKWPLPEAFLDALAVKPRDAR